MSERLRDGCGHASAGRRRRAPFGRGREREQRGIGTEGETRESGERCKGSRGVRGTLGCLQRRAGKQEVAGALGRAPPSSFGARGRKTTGGEAAVVGWARPQPQCRARWAER